MKYDMPLNFSKEIVCIKYLIDEILIPDLKYTQQMNYK